MIFLSHFPEKKNLLKSPMERERGLEAAVPLRSRKERRKKKRLVYFWGWWRNRWRGLLGSASNTFNEFRLSASAPNLNDVGAVSRRYFTFRFRAPSLLRFYIFISIFVFFQTAKWLTHSIGELELNVNKVDSTMRCYHSLPIHPPCTCISLLL